MANSDLPQKINVLKLAEQEAHLKGKVSLKGMSRLLSMLVSDVGDAAIEWHFGRDEDKVVFIKGEVVGHVQLCCQRCLKPADFTIQDSVSLSPILSEMQADSLPEYYEPVLIDDDVQALLPLIEDELILRVPMVPMHNVEDCPVKNDILGADEALDSETIVAEHPFAMLAKLKNVGE